MCEYVRERERVVGGSTQKEKVQEEWAQCYQHVLLFFHLFVHYQHIKHYFIVHVSAARAVVGRVDGQPVAQQPQWRVVNKAYEAEMIYTVHKHNC